MTTHDIITIGASAGGIQTLIQLVALLPGDLPAALMIVQHLHPRFDSNLPALLEWRGTLPAAFARDGEPINNGRVYIAPPDHHVLVEPNRLRVVRGPKENRHRPAVDPLFRSAAWAYGPRVVGVVLSGMLDDGAAGLWAVRSCGGVTVVQDPAEALHAGMPTSALMTLNVDHCLPLAGIAELLRKLSREPIDPRRRVARPVTVGVEAATVNRENDTNVEDMQQLGKPAGFACPTCHGGLWELDDGELLRYRCHVGHAFGPDSLLAEQSEDVETALESALRALEERGATARRLGERFTERAPTLAAHYAAQAEGIEQQTAVLRRVLRGERMPWLGFEPRRLAALPPQDSVSTSSTTRAGAET